MNQLETDFRAALHDRAARVHASSTLRTADYRPRARGLRDVWAISPARRRFNPSPRLAIGGGLLTAAGAAAAVLTLAGATSNAFAGWTRHPSKASRTQLAAADAYCDANVPTAGLPTQLVDARGPFTFEIRSNGSSTDFCTTGPGLENASGWTASPPVRPAAGTLFLWTDHTSTDNAQSFGTMIAQAGDDVSAVNLTLDDGSSVTATVENGWVVAWWPGTAHVASAQLTTPSGTQTQTFNYPCDVYNCNGGGPHGGAPGGGPGGG